MQLGIFEPPRFFEAFLRGRALSARRPTSPSRICGICPVAYQMSACHAMEDALGIRVDGALRELRRLLYCGEWIESHALHVFLLHAPGLPRLPGRARDGQGRTATGSATGLRIKKAGNAIVERARRPRDPPDQRPGRRLLPRAPTRAELEVCSPSCAGRATRPPRMRPLGRRPSRSPTSSATTSSWRCATRTSTRSARGGSSRRAASTSTFATTTRTSSRSTSPHSNALHSRMRGPRRLPVRAARALQPATSTGCRRRCRRWRAELGVDAAVPEPVPEPASCACVEMVHAFEEAIAIIERYQPPAAPFVDAPRAPRSATAAPRRRAGFSTTATRSTTAGTILDARIVPPTSQNQLAIEEDFCALGAAARGSAPTKARPSARSRPSATTTRASPARRTFSSSGWNADDPLSHRGGRATARGR